MPKSGARLPKSESTRIKLLDCAIAEILETGPDHVGFTAVARRADMSTGALYARYENVDELLLEVWLHRALPALRHLIAEMQESLETSDGRPARRRIADVLRAPDSQVCLIAKLLVVARRNETLGEFVIPSTIDVINKAMTTTPAFDFYLAQVLGIAIGVQGTGLVGLDWFSPISIVASSTREAKEFQAVDDATESIPEAFGLDEGLEDLDRRLFGAVSRVISRVGIDNATISRIARHADINPATIYLKYDDKNDLMAACVSHVMGATYGQNQGLLESLSSLSSANSKDGFKTPGVAMFRGNQSKDHSETRLLRLETMFGAAHDEELRIIIEKIFHQMLRADEKTLGIPDNAEVRQSILPVLTFSRFAFYGQALLGEYGFVSPNHPYLISYLKQTHKRLLRSMSTVPEA